MPLAREQLYDATDRLLGRDGPTGISTRAITDEAGCAKGILHNHFGDLDGFLTAYTRDRIDRITERAQSLPALAGQHTVLDNLATAVVDLFGSGAAAIAALMAARPALQAKLREGVDGRDPVFDDVQRAIAAYLAAEKQLGRLAAEDADVGMLAFTLVGATHHLFFTSGLQPVAPQDVRRVVAALLVRSTGPDKPRRGTSRAR
jgi:AcrR family transcriptional regulator